MKAKTKEQQAKEVKTMQDRDFSKYIVVEEDGLVWLVTSKGYSEKTPQGFNTQEDFIEALAKSTNEYYETNCLDAYKYRLRYVSEVITSKYGNKTEEELREDIINGCNANEREQEDTLRNYLDMVYDMYSVMCLYQQYLMVSRKDMNVYNEVINWYIIDDTEADNKSDKQYCYMNIDDGEVGHEVTKLMLTNEERIDFEKNLVHNEISITQRVYEFIACVRLARKLVEEYKDFIK